ncbi:MAG: VOC family protein [Candidatus Eremiobacteraeota bacterium]|nr:VOC family protein [Candidatus Eremiobacteraeota bacterium]
MKTHINFHTRDLDKSVAFYSALLNAKPAKHFPDYALFVTDEPGLELALDLDARTKAGEGAHYGLVVDQADAVEAQIERLQAAKLPADIETEQTCCYAVQNKVWATDPDGRRWETYYVLEETDERDGPETSTCCAASEDAATSSGCC